MVYSWFFYNKFISLKEYFIHDLGCNYDAYWLSVSIFPIILFSVLLLSCLPLDSGNIFLFNIFSSISFLVMHAFSRFQYATLSLIVYVKLGLLPLLEKQKKH